MAEAATAVTRSCTRDTDRISDPPRVTGPRACPPSPHSSPHPLALHAQTMSGQAAAANVTGQTAQQRCVSPVTGVYDAALTFVISTCSGILIKLLIFAAALAIAPVSSYFLSKDYLWDGV